MANYLDAVFAYFGDDEPNDELRAILIERIEPTDQEQDDILGANPNETEYCNKVHGALMSFIADPDLYISALVDDDPRKVELVGITKTHKARTEQPESGIKEPGIVPVAVQLPTPTPASVALTVSSDANLMLSGHVVTPKPPQTTPNRIPSETPSAAPDAAQQTPKTQSRDKMGKKRDDTQESIRLTGKELIAFFDNPDGFVAERVEKFLTQSGLKEVSDAIKTKKLLSVTTSQGKDPITAEMRAHVVTKTWKTMRDTLVNAYRSGDLGRLTNAEKLRDAYLHGQYGVSGRCFGALMRECMKDLAARLNETNQEEFRRRYYD